MEQKRFGRINQYSETVLSIDEAVILLQMGSDVSGMIIDSAYEIEQFNKFSSHILEEDVTIKKETTDIDVKDYHESCASRWNFPEEYRSVNVLKLLLERCNTQAERERVEMEYKMYEDRELVILLQFLLWLVDHMREHGILWGVGRGSSVSSICLYLIGINRVNPLDYGLDIHEFLK